MIGEEKKGIVFDIQSFSTHDGPGIRTNIFLKGCYLKCLWCANPEGQNFKPELFYKEEKCKGCLKCANTCKNDAISLNNEEVGKGFIKIDRKFCKTCETLDCVRACYEDALTVMGKEMSVKEVMKVVLRDQPFYRNGGGVTLSGGDPLCQVDFALEILKECKKNYINTAVESELCVPYSSVEKVFPYVDLFLCDIKIVDENKHIEATGVSNKIILENLEKIAEKDPSKVCIRVPVIPKFSDSEENIRNIAKFCKENGYGRINLLPYHKLGASKFEKLGMEYKMPEVNVPSHEYMLSLGKIIESYGLICVVNG